jgi:hypothetical protein
MLWCSNDVITILLITQICNLEQFGAENTSYGVVGTIHNFYTIIDIVLL